MRTYETMLLLDPRLQDAEIEGAIERFSSFVGDRAGEVDNVERWGRRRLAYELEDLQEGYYAIVTYRLSPESREELEAVLPFLEGLIRAKTVRPVPRKRRV